MGLEEEDGREPTGTAGPGKDKTTKPKRLIKTECHNRIT